MNLQAAIFDFNGTLSDDEPILFRIFGELFAKAWRYDLARDDYFARLAGRSDREIIETVAGETMASATPIARLTVVNELLDSHGRRYREIVAQDCPIRPATVELVQALTTRGIPIAIVTGAQRADVLHVLSHSPVAESFAHLIAEEDVERGKPDPQGFLMAAAAFGTEPVNILVFEDSVAGIRGATAAGMRCIAVRGTHDEATLRGETDIVVGELSPEALNLL